MKRSTHLSNADVEAAMRLIGECRELWADPDAWRQHLLKELCGLTGNAIGHYAETAPLRPCRPVQWLVNADCGWRDDGCRAIYMQYAALTADSYNPFPGYDQLLNSIARTGRAAVLRPELCDDRAWYRCSFWADFRRPAYNDGFIMSFIENTGAGFCTQLGIHQDPSDPPPNLWTKRMVTFVHDRIAPMIGVALATERERSGQGLTPRLRQMLDQLLAGDSEKRIARAMGIRPSTAHEYIQKVYRHFEVESRAELMAYFVARQPLPRN